MMYVFEKSWCIFNNLVMYDLHSKKLDVWLCNYIILDKFVFMVFFESNDDFNSASGDARWEYWRHWSIRQSSVTYIRTRMYQSTELRLHILWCGRLVDRQEKLTLDKKDLKDRKSLMFLSFQAIFCTIFITFLNFDTSNSPKLHCFECKHTEQHYNISKLKPIVTRFKAEDYS